MIFVHIRHSVEDFGKWKAVFDSHDSTRKAAGSTGESYVMRNTDNPNEVTVLVGWDNVENARNFSNSPDLMEAMQQSGVTGRPDVSYLETAS